MKHIIIAVITFATVSASVAAPYVGLNLNWTKVSDANDASFAPEIAIGGKLGMIRAEGAFTYQKDDFGSIDLKTSTIFGNVYFDFGNEESKLTPYLLGGVGYSSVKAEETVTGIEADDSGVLGQFGGGAALSVGKNGAVDFRYKYQFGKEYEFLGESYRPSAHVLSVGYRHSF